MERKKKQTKTHRTMNTTVVLILVLAIVAATGALAYYVFQITDVDVAGNENFSAEQIVSLSRVKMGDHLFLQSADAIADKLRDEPFLVLERIELVLPGKLVLHVRERVIVAAAATQGGYALVDDTGFVVRMMQSEGGFIRIEGFAPAMAVAGEKIEGWTEYQAFCFETVMRLLSEEKMLHLFDAIDISQPVAMKLTTKAGIRVKFGVADTLTQGVEWTKRILPSLIAEGKTSGTLDVSGNTDPRFIPAQTTSD